MFVRFAVLAASVAAAAAASAFEEIPRASATALGVTRGKQFSAGIVFVNGKYVEPPYVVERWGTGIRINSIPVTGQIIDWVEFVKTQDPSIVTKVASAPESAAPAPAYSQPPPSAPAKSDADALDDLFDDDPAPKKPATSWTPPVRAAPPPPKAPAPTYTLVGKFVKNDASKALVKRINDQRTEIDGILRRGGFIFFGDGYSRVAGDARALDTMLAKLPETMQRSADVGTFRAGIRSGGMVYINEILAEQLFANRIDYRKLQERRRKMKSDREWSRMINEASRPLL